MLSSTVENHTIRARFAIARFTPALLLLGLICFATFALFVVVAVGAQGQTAEEMAIEEANAINDAVIAEAMSAETGNPDGRTPAEETVCDGLIGAAFGFCNAYCEAQDCDVRELGRNSCEQLRRNFERHTGTPTFPCDALCGNGTVDAGEDCDPPFQFCRGGCSPLLGICVDMACSEACSCPKPFCGDLVVDPGEECDDGNNAGGDSCSGDCFLEGALCGGFAGIPCQRDEFCQFAPNTCGIRDLFGVCTQIPFTCIGDCSPVFDPVCGCDGITYFNDCDRRCGRTSLAHQGECVAGERCSWLVCPPDRFCCSPLEGICTQPGQACVQ